MNSYHIIINLINKKYRGFSFIADDHSDKNFTYAIQAVDPMEWETG